jgi:hypothetical protein
MRRVRPTPTQGRAEESETHFTPRLHPDLSRQSEFSLLHFLFPNMETALKGKRFQEVEGIKINMTAELGAVLLEAFADCFQKLFKRLNKYIQVGEDYFEYK